jgi:hypothetical protein
MEARKFPEPIASEPWPQGQYGERCPALRIAFIGAAARRHRGDGDAERLARTHETHVLPRTHRGCVGSTQRRFAGDRTQPGVLPIHSKRASGGTGCPPWKPFARAFPVPRSIHFHPPLDSKRFATVVLPGSRAVMASRTAGIPGTAEHGQETGCSAERGDVGAACPRDGVPSSRAQRSVGMRHASSLSAEARFGRYGAAQRLENIYQKVSGTP